MSADSDTTKLPSGDQNVMLHAARKAGRSVDDTEFKSFSDGWTARGDWDNERADATSVAAQRLLEIYGRGTPDEKIDEAIEALFHAMYPEGSKPTVQSLCSSCGKTTTFVLCSKCAANHAPPKGDLHRAEQASGDNAAKIAAAGAELVLNAPVVHQIADDSLFTRWQHGDGYIEVTMFRADGNKITLRLSPPALEALSDTIFVEECDLDCGEDTCVQEPPCDRHA